jgi:hypothetical protein
MLDKISEGAVQYDVERKHVIATTFRKRRWQNGRTIFKSADKDLTIVQARPYRF